MINLDSGIHALQQARHDEAAADVSRAEEAGQAFEGYLVEMMVREMRKTIPEGLFSGNAMEMFSGMLDQELSKRIAESGGLGMGNVIARDVLHSERAPAPRRPSPVGGLLRNSRLPVRGRISSRFGHRTDPIHKKTRMHKGLDIAAPRGTDVRPVRGGTVVFAGERGGFGNTVIVDHGGGWRSLYAHCDRLNVQPGQRVGTDTVIAAVGSTGRSTGPHLHLELHRDGQAVDPAEALGLK